MKKLGMIACCVLVGCSTTSYNPQEYGSNIASLVIPMGNNSFKLFNSSTAHVQFGVAGDDGCGDYFGAPKAETEDATSVDVVIPADRVVFVGFRATLNEWSCEAAGHFIPSKGKTYKAVSAGDGRGCQLALVEVEGGQEIRPIVLGPIKKKGFYSKLCME